MHDNNYYVIIPKTQLSEYKFNPRGGITDLNDGNVEVFFSKGYRSSGQHGERSEELPQEQDIKIITEKLTAAGVQNFEVVTH